MDGAVPFACRPPTKLPGGFKQRPLLLLRLWPRRGRDPLRGALSPGEVPASRGVAAPMARGGACVARSGTLLSDAVTPPQRSGRLSIPTRSPFLGANRAHANRLRPRRLPARLADTVGPLFAGSARGRPGDRRGLRRIRASDRLSAGGQSLWPQHFARGAASPLFAGLQRRFVRMEASSILSGSDSGRGSVRLRRVVGGRFSQRHLLAGDSSQCAPVSATVRRSPNRLPDL